MKRIIIFALIIATVAGARAQEFSMVNFSWNVSLPMSDQSDFISDASLRGFSMGGVKMITPYIGVGGSFSWEVFNERESGTFTNSDGIVISGLQLRYMNVLPIMANVRYFLGEDGSIRPFFGLGVGTIRGRKRIEMGIFVVEDNTWHFGLEPEAGVLIPFGISGWGASLSMKFDYGVKSNDITYSYMGFKIGLSKID